MVEMKLVYDGVKEAANSLGMTVEQFKVHQKEAFKNDPANNKKERYQLTDVSYGWTYFDTLKKETRHYAKRQLTWFKREKDIIYRRYGIGKYKEQTQKNIAKSLNISRAEATILPLSRM